MDKPFRISKKKKKEEESFIQAQVRTAAWDIQSSQRKVLQRNV